jgi:hypothetical protein
MSKEKEKKFLGSLELTYFGSLGAELSHCSFRIGAGLSEKKIHELEWKLKEKNVISLPLDCYLREPLVLKAFSLDAYGRPLTVGTLSTTVNSLVIPAPKYLPIERDTSLSSAVEHYAFSSQITICLAGHLIADEAGAARRKLAALVKLKPELGAAFENTPRGARVVSVQPGSASSVAGLMIGDVLVSVDGVLVPTLVAFRERFAACAPGRECQLSVRRAAGSGPDGDVRALRLVPTGQGVTSDEMTRLLALAAETRPASPKNPTTTTTAATTNPFASALAIPAPACSTEPADPIFPRFPYPGPSDLPIDDTDLFGAEVSIPGLSSTLSRATPSPTNPFVDPGPVYHTINSHNRFTLPSSNPGAPAPSTLVSASTVSKPEKAGVGSTCTSTSKSIFLPSVSRPANPFAEPGPAPPPSVSRPSNPFAEPGPGAGSPAPPPTFSFDALFGVDEVPTHDTREPCFNLSSHSRTYTHANVRSWGSIDFDMSTGPVGPVYNYTI